MPMPSDDRPAVSASRLSMSLGIAASLIHREKPELAREKPAPKPLVFRPIVAGRAAGSAPGPCRTSAMADLHNLTLLAPEPDVTCACCDGGCRKFARRQLRSV